MSIDEAGAAIMVMPYMKNGDLATYIRDEHVQLSVLNLLIFAIDVAKGKHDQDQEWLKGVSTNTPGLNPYSQT